MAAVAGNAVCFEPFKLDLKAGELHQDGRKILLQEQPFQVLKNAAGTSRRGRDPGGDPQEALAP